MPLTVRHCVYLLYRISTARVKIATARFVNSSSVGFRIFEEETSQRLKINRIEASRSETSKVQTNVYFRLTDGISEHREKGPITFT